MPKHILSYQAPKNIAHDFEKKVFWYFRFIGHQELKDVWDVTAEHANLRIESLAKHPHATVTCRFVVKESMCGPQMHLHGGYIATLVENLTSILIVAAATPGRFADTGVSRNLRTIYLRSLPVGTEVRAVCQVISLGQRLVLTKAEFYDVETGELCVISEHEKFNRDPEQRGKL
ncbi:PaaI family thioesterase [Aspergillus homomorphus CBS 101889]|uniref:Thioesterase family protein n=1 Tax=Aspergillus homomorphus (strain CBS 101889) TaxID=1450537 RepID=A0A395I2J0_ASPHC|nr:thioesterase family protein [Aspergillus homomorphus CBS 101889]RAL13398.1 thioesterase family protein [Aspergillus homomorphus CBS 101889]